MMDQAPSSPTTATLVVRATAMTSLSDAENDEEAEINVDTDSEDSRGSSASPLPPSVPTSRALTFSISRLLGEPGATRPGSAMAAAAAAAAAAAVRPNAAAAAATLEALYGPLGAGVIRVPAHRPPPPPPPPPHHFPWLDPQLQRNVAAAAFASHVVKERLSGKSLIKNVYSQLF